MVKICKCGFEFCSMDDCLTHLPHCRQEEIPLF